MQQNHVLIPKCLADIRPANGHSEVLKEKALCA